MRNDKDWQVRTGEWIYWPISEKSSLLDSYLPDMKTDIVLRHTSTKRHIIIDTKFADILKPGRFRDKTFKSGYVYQMYAHLKAQRREEGALRTEGILLHPAVGETINEYALIQGDVVRFATVDLSGTVEEISDQLMRLIRVEA